MNELFVSFPPTTKKCFRSEVYTEDLPPRGITQQRAEVLGYRPRPAEELDARIYELLEVLIVQQVGAARQPVE